MDPIDDFDAAQIASSWHSVMTWSDPGVAMYSVTSTGKVHSERHRAQLLDYIDTCLVQAAKLDERGEDPTLDISRECGFSNTDELNALKEWALAYNINPAKES